MLSSRNEGQRQMKEKLVAARLKLCEADKACKEGKYLSKAQRIFAYVDWLVAVEEFNEGRR